MHAYCLFLSVSCFKPGFIKFVTIFWKKKGLTGSFYRSRFRTISKQVKFYPSREHEVLMLKSILRHFGRQKADKVSCPLSFGSRSLRRMRWQSSMLFRR
jgi:hypothetical protein